MTVDVIGTGSSGNAVVLEKSILLDCGMPWSKIQPYSKYLRLVFVGHSHS